MRQEILASTPERQVHYHECSSCRPCAPKVAPTLLSNARLLWITLVVCKVLRRPEIRVLSMHSLGIVVLCQSASQFAVMCILRRTHRNWAPKSVRMSFKFRCATFAIADCKSTGESPDLSHGDASTWRIYAADVMASCCNC